MPRGWSAVTVTHEISAVATADTSGGLPVVEAVLGSMLTVEVTATNHGQADQAGLFRLVGLGRPLVATADPIAPTGVPELRRLEFELPDRLDPGWNPVTIEWIRVGDGQTKRLAVTDLLVVVDDVSSARVEITPKLVKGLLGGTAKVMLENTGERELRLSLGVTTPRGSRLIIDFTPDVVQLAPGRLCYSTAHIKRRARWLGSSRTHVFDVHARAASGMVTTSGTFRQYTVLPPILFKAAALIATIVLATVLLLRLVRTVVDDEAPAAWVSVAEAPEDLVARVDHTATWMSFVRRDANTGSNGALDRTREFVTGADDTERGVLVWGGVDAAGRPLATGAIYSVTDEEWLPVSPLPGDEARFQHTAAWTGERVVIWGGVGTARLTSFYGAEYDPTTDDWDPLPPSGLEPRVGHSMIWTGRELIVFGGVAADGRVLSDGGILRAGPVQDDGASTVDDEADLSNGVWSLFRAGDLGALEAAPRAYHSASWDGRYMLITGGLSSDGRLLSDAFAYDVARNRWNLVNNALFEPRACHQSVATGSGVLILGGLRGEDLRGTDRAQRAPLGGLCDPMLGTDRTDPTAWHLVLEPDPDDPRRPLFGWQVVADAPEHLGTDFVANWTGSAVGIVQLVPELDSVAPVRYTPGSETTIGALPDEGQLDVRSELTAAWDGAEAFVWGGRGEEPCGSADGAEGCLASNGAVFDVGT